MPSKPGRRIRCGAKSRRNSGAPCKNWAFAGARRCRMHGGTHPKGGAAPQATQRLKHGLFARAFTDEEKQRFNEVFAEMSDDPTVAMMADAALMRVKAATAAARADAAGMIVTRQGATKRTEPSLDAFGKQIFYTAEDGTTRPLNGTIETVTAERADVMGSVADLLMRAHRLSAASVMLRKKGGFDDDKVVGALTEQSMGDIMRREFNDSGALHQEEADGVPKSSGAGQPRQGR